MDAETYLKHWKKNQVWTHYKWPKHQKRFLQIALRLTGETCLDVGCGFGHSTRILATHYKAKWSGLEFNAHAAERARGLFPKIEFIYSAGYDFKAACGDREFDSVVCSEVIEHIEDDRSFLAALMDITRKKLILTTPNRPVDDPGHLRLYTGNSLERLFEGYDYTVKSFGGYYFMEVIVK